MDEKLDAPERKPSPPEEAPPPVIREDVVVRGGATRCPHCHASVDPEQDAWAACQKCLARHHLACWGEGGACGACGERRFVTSVGTPKKRSPRRGPAAVALALAAVIAFALSTVASRHGKLDAVRQDALLRADRLEKELAQAKLERDAARAVAPGGATKVPGTEPGYAARVFTLKQDFGYWYVPADGSNRRQELIQNATLDEIALRIADRLNSLASISPLLPDHARVLAVLTKVEATLARDGTRPEDLAKVREALATLRKG